MTLDYIAATGVRTPITVQVKKVPYNDVAKFITTDTDTRNQWCQTGKPCAKYNCRPCCPPRVKTLDRFKRMKYFYIVCVGCSMEEYMKAHPSIAKAKSANFLALKNSHSLTRNIQNRIVMNFEGQAFGVGGCLGCTYTRKRHCKRFRPSLEATGVNVVDLAERLFGITIEWMTNGKLMSHIYAIGGIYTDEEISPKQFKRLIRIACHNTV